MGRAAYLRRQNVEDDLDRDDEQYIKQAPFSVGQMPMSKKKSGPHADDPHHAPRRPNHLRRSQNFQLGERNNTEC